MRAYDSDLSQFLAHAARGRRREACATWRRRSSIALALRGFLGELHKQGQSRATAARKLAAARTFLRYLRREGLIDDDPGALVAHAEARRPDAGAPVRRRDVGAD